MWLSQVFSSTPNLPQALLDEIRNDRHKKLDLSKGKLTQFNPPIRCLKDVDAETLAEVLKTNTSLEELTLDENEIGVIGARALAQMLETNRTLKKLSLSKNKILSGGARAFVIPLETNNTLTHLDVGQNSISKEAAEALSEVLKKNHTLLSLYISEEEIRNHYTYTIFKSSENGLILDRVGFNEKLAKIYQNSNEKIESFYCYSDSDLILFSDAIKANTKSETLYIIINRNLRELAAIKFSEAIKQNTQLRNIQIKINDSDSQAISQALFGIFKNPRITTIEILNMELTYELVDNISLLLTHHETIKTLSLTIRNNFKPFFKALKTNKSLKKLNMAETTIDNKETMIEFIDALANSSISSLSFFNNHKDLWDYINKKIFPEATVVLAEFLKKNPKISTLDLTFRTMEDAGIALVANALQYNNQLRLLNIQQTGFTDSGAEAIANMLAKNHTLSIGTFAFNPASTNLGDQKIISSLRYNKGLVVAKIGYGKFHNTEIGGMNTATFQCITDMLIHNRTLVNLSIPVENLNEASAAVLVDGIKYNRTLTNITWLNFSFDSYSVTSNPKRKEELIKRLSPISEALIPNQKNALQLRIYCKAKNYKEVKKLLEYGVSPCSPYSTSDEKTENASTVLHQAVQEEDTELIKLLLDPKYYHGHALLAMCDQEGLTALELAIKENKTVIIKLLEALEEALYQHPKTSEETSAWPISNTASSGSLILSPSHSNASSNLDAQGRISVSIAINPSDITWGALISNRGGFGDIYKGKLNGSDIAIKRLRAKQLSKKTIEEFEREASIMAQLNSERIVRLYGITLTEPYMLIMELMHTSLYDLLHSKTELVWPIRIQIASDIAHAVIFLHAKKIIHADLKSLNILLTRDLRAKLGDFGMSQIKIETVTQTSESNTGGTLLWKAPELLQRKKPSVLSDIYAYGVIIWEIISRQLPFSDAQGDSSLIRDWIINGLYDYQLDESLPILSQVPNNIRKVMEGCWQKVPEQRISLEAAIQQLESNDEAPLATLDGLASNWKTGPC